MDSALAKKIAPDRFLQMHRVITLLGSALLVIAILNCSDKKQAPVTWNMTIKDAGQDVLMDITGATILFQAMTYEGTDQVELKIFDPGDKTGLVRSADACSPGQPGRPSLGTSICSIPQKCEIRFGPHLIIVRDKGHSIEIDGTQFRIIPGDKPGFLVDARVGKVSILEK